jgi:hypothetical protein
VLTALLRETLERVRTLMERQTDDLSFAPPEKISRSVAIEFSARQLREVLEVVFQDDDTLRILLREAVGLDVDIEKLLGEIDETLIAIVEKSLVASHRAGFTRDLDARAVATMVVGGVEKLALAALRSEAVDLDALAREAAQLHAIGTLSDRPDDPPRSMDLPDRTWLRVAPATSSRPTTSATPASSARPRRAPARWRASITRGTSRRGTAGP